MAFSEGQYSDTYSMIISEVSEEAILAYYLNITELPASLKAPYRIDNVSSVRIGYTPFGYINYYDFGTNEHGNIFDFLAKVWGMKTSLVKDKVLREKDKINAQNIQITSRPKSIQNSTSNLRRKVSNIKVRTREWKDYDLEFWNSFGINKEWLEFGQIYPISHLLYSNFSSDNLIVVPCEKYAYTYVEFKDGEPTFKIYQPFSKDFKWLSSHNSSVWDLWSQLPDKGERLIITSSRKDALSIWANTGIPATGLQGEGYIPKEHVVNQLKERFDTIYVLYDNDFNKEINQGRLYSMNLASQFDLQRIEIPQEYQSKDPSDLFRNWGSVIQREVIFQLITTGDSDIPF